VPTSCGTVDLEIVVVSYRSRELLLRCLASLEAHPPGGRVLVRVVDNDSRDGTAEAVRADFPEVCLDVLGRNAGFSVANNVALREATAPYVLVLNPDTEVHAGTLDHLLTVMAERPDVGMTGCRLVQPDGSFDHAAKRSFPTPVSALAHFAGIGRRSGAAARIAQYRAPALDERAVGEVDAVNGAFMLVRREALEHVGLLDEGYWLYMEDLDWCARFWARGWKVLYDGRVSVTHVKGGSAGSHRSLKTNLHFHRGMGRFYRRHQAGRSAAVDLAVYVGIGVKLGVSAVWSAIARRRTQDGVEAAA
jgi:N-acetylglucosaminyl-diphospho-decaprenol L-rhamnosyltransferase